MEEVRAFLTDEPLTLAMVLAGGSRRGDGALVHFSGVVRDHSEGRTVEAIEYEAYAPMAEEMLLRICREAVEHWPEARVCVGHRVGCLTVGEASIIIAATAPHRAEAFNACRYTIDRIKELVPIWKREFGPDGEWYTEGRLAKP